VSPDLKAVTGGWQRPKDSVSQTPYRSSMLWTSKPAALSVDRLTSGAASPVLWPIRIVAAHISRPSRIAAKDVFRCLQHHDYSRTIRGKIGTTKPR
jgi:hypothetical protein